eukprot:GHVH01001204.1.p1 GENE.GHVH01001204.1~~GHVH01001204.1.p1  ORF type:complete len:1002 (-),score=127.71 GHVH01001204.1:8-3013(-)
MIRSPVTPRPADTEDGINLELSPLHSLKIWSLSALGYPLQTIGFLSLILLSSVLLQYVSTGNLPDELILRVILYVCGISTLVVHMVSWLVLSSPFNIDAATSCYPSRNAIASAIDTARTSRRKFLAADNGLVLCFSTLRARLETQRIVDGSSFVLVWRQRLLMIIILYTNVSTTMFCYSAIAFKQPGVAVVVSSLLFSVLETLILATGVPPSSAQSRGRWSWVAQILDPLRCSLWNLPHAVAGSGSFRDPISSLNDRREKRRLFLSDWNCSHRGFLSCVPWQAMTSPSVAIKSRLERSLVLSPFALASLNASVRSLMLGVLTSRLIMKLPVLKILANAVALIILLPHAVINRAFGIHWQLQGDPYLPISFMILPSKAQQLPIWSRVGEWSPAIAWLLICYAFAFVVRTLLREYMQLMVLHNKDLDFTTGTLQRALESPLWVDKVAAFSNLSANFSVMDFPLKWNYMFGGFLIGTGPVPVVSDTPGLYVSSVWSEETQKLIQSAPNMIVGGPQNLSLIDATAGGVEARDSLYLQWLNGSLFAPTYNRPWFCPRWLWPFVLYCYRTSDTFFAMVQIVFVLPFRLVTSLFLCMGSIMAASDGPENREIASPNSSLEKRYLRESVAIAASDAFPESCLHHFLRHVNGFPTRDAIKGSLGGLFIKGSNAATNCDPLNFVMTEKLLRMAGSGALPMPAVVHVAGVPILHPMIPQALQSPHRLCIPASKHLENPFATENIMRMDSTFLPKKSSPLSHLWSHTHDRILELSSCLRLVSRLLVNPVVMYTPDQESMPSGALAAVLCGPRQLNMNELVYRVGQDLLDELQQIADVYPLLSGENAFTVFFYGSDTPNSNGGYCPTRGGLQKWSFRVDNDAILLTAKEYQCLVSTFTALLQPVIILGSLAFATIVHLIKTATALDGGQSCITLPNELHIWKRELELMAIDQLTVEYQQLIKASIQAIIATQSKASPSPSQRASILPPRVALEIAFLELLYLVDEIGFDELKAL